MKRVIAVLAVAMLMLVGCKGDTGPVGPDGAQGTQGDQGIQGDKGDNGDLGPQGPQGDPGQDGTNGQDGQDGDQGPQGIDGERGPTGNMGPKGDEGQQGEPGVAEMYWESFEGVLGPPWTWSGDIQWDIWLSGRYGNQSAVSGIITHDQSSGHGLTTSFEKGGTVSFFAAVSSELDFDWLVWAVDGVTVDGISGTATDSWWYPFSFPVPPGEHLIQFVYMKDNDISEGIDAGWIDGVMLIGSSGTAKVSTPTVLPEGIVLWSQRQEGGPKSK